MSVSRGQVCDHQLPKPPSSRTGNSLVSESTSRGRGRQHCSRVHSVPFLTGTRTEHGKTRLSCMFGSRFYHHQPCDLARISQTRNSNVGVSKEVWLRTLRASKANTTLAGPWQGTRRNPRARMWRQEDQELVTRRPCVSKSPTSIHKSVTLPKQRRVPSNSHHCQADALISFHFQMHVNRTHEEGQSVTQIQADRGEHFL